MTKASMVNASGYEEVLVDCCERGQIALIPQAFLTNAANANQSSKPKAEPTLTHRAQNRKAIESTEIMMRTTVKWTIPNGE